MGMPEINFQTVSRGIMTLPAQESATNEFIGWIHQKGMARSCVQIRHTKQGTEYHTDFSAETVAISLGRTAATAFILPVIATLGAMYNAGAGIAKIGLGLVAHMKITPQMQKKDADGLRDLARQSMTEGLEHIMTAVYDFAVGMFSTIIALVYGVAPSQVEQGHEKVFLGKRSSHDDDGEEIPAEQSYIAQGAERAVDSILPKAAQAHLSFFDRLLGKKA
jgi:hypothetical protein